MTHVDAGLPRLVGIYRPFNVTIGQGMTMYVDSAVGISVCGTMFVTGTVKVAGEGGLNNQAQGLRLGALSALGGSVLLNESTLTQFVGGVRDDECDE